MLDETTTGEAGSVAAAPEMAADPVLTPCGCRRPAVQTMDYKKYSPDDWSNPEPRINRVCLKCWAHWFGPPDAVKFYTSKEWDAWISSSQTVS